MKGIQSSNKKLLQTVIGVPFLITEKAGGFRYATNRRSRIPQLPPPKFGIVFNNLLVKKFAIIQRVKRHSYE